MSELDEAPNLSQMSLFKQPSLTLTRFAILILLPASEKAENVALGRPAVYRVSLLAV